MIIVLMAFIICSVLVAVVVGVIGAAVMLKIEALGGGSHSTPSPFEGASPDTEVPGREGGRLTLVSH